MIIMTLWNISITKPYAINLFIYVIDNSISVYSSVTYSHAGVHGAQ